MMPEVAAEREQTPIPGTPQRGGASGPFGTTGRQTEAAAAPTGDAGILALVIALGENELHAAMDAVEKKPSDAIADFDRASIAAFAQGHREALQMIDEWLSAAQNASVSST